MPQLHGLFHTLLLSLLYMVPAMRISSNNSWKEHQSKSVETPRRQLQQTFNYRANYTAEFQHYRDPLCTGDAPVVQVSCFSAQNMTILGTSSESIQCSRIDSSGNEGFLSYECVTTCNGTACNDVYLSTQFEKLIDGPYGSIQFMCEGDDFRQVDAVFRYFGGNNGSCSAITTSSLQNGQSLHIAKLGISCPVESSNGAVSDSREYVYDDTYFECNFLGSSSASATAFDSVSGSSDIYTCLTGGTCNYTECTDIAFNDIVIDSVIPNFLYSCVESTLPSITTIPTPSPVIRTVGATLTQVQFEASWANLYDSATSGITGNALATCQLVDNTAVRISCGNGAIAIRFHNSTDPIMNCTTVSDNELSCIGNETNIQNNLVSVFYDCFGGAMSTSQITLPETKATCDGNNIDVVFQNIVIMGLKCPEEANWFYSDILFECGSPSHDFYVAPGSRLGVKGDRLTCSESTILPSASSASDVQVIPSVSITTDSRWLRDPILQQCFKTVDSIPTASPFVAPTVAPATSVSQPVIIQPVSLPVMINTNVPVPAAPTLNISPSAGNTNGNEDNSTIFAVVGGIVGGIAISLVALFIYRKGKSDGNRIKHNNNATGSQSNGSTDQLTHGNSDHLTRNSGSTNKRPSSSVTGTSQSGMSASDVQSPGRLFTTTPADASNAYAIDYKDQARSVDDALPVMNSARPLNAGSARYEDMPIAMAIPMTDASVAGTAVHTKKIPPNKVTLFDL